MTPSVPVPEAMPMTVPVTMPMTGPVTRPVPVPMAVPVPVPGPVPVTIPGPLACRTSAGCIRGDGSSCFRDEDELLDGRRGCGRGELRYPEACERRGQHADDVDALHVHPPVR